MRDPASHRLTVGSSPLARGLLLGEVLPVPHVGIIPARAGFTATISPHEPSTSDHPRSRGVYSSRSEYWWVYLGSSPLARGLPTHQRDRLRRRGIIPARARFTTSSGTARWPATDHPRSRGVYGSSRKISLASVGSSPLARGLQRRLIDAEFREGIIPARAGFTISDASTSGDTTDHPRSRGVYLSASPFTPAIAGSSPLARGLPQRKVGKKWETRIIPARAGFTSSANCLSS